MTSLVSSALLWPRPCVAAAHGAIRAVVPHLEEDRSPAPDIDQVLDMVRSGALLTAGEQAA